MHRHDEQRAKRRKIALACAECRERKRKCDGATPVCGACARRSAQVACSYTGESLKRGDSTYVESLRARIRQLEDICGNAAVQTTSTKAGNLSVNVSMSTRMAGQAKEDAIATAQLQKTQRLDAVAASGQNHLREEAIVPELTTTVASSPDGDLPDDADVDFAVDAMGSSGIMNDAANTHRKSESAYFGASSNIEFMNQVQNAVHGRRESAANAEGTALRSHASTGRTSNSPDTARMRLWHGQSREQKEFSNSAEFCIPPRKEADALLESYWTWVHSLHPFLHKASFMERYLKIWLPETAKSASGVEDVDGKNESSPPIDERLFYCMLNAVFALGCQFHSHIDIRDRVPMGQKFYVRAKALLSFDALDKGSIELVQTLLLVGQYLQSTEMPGLCWNVAGLAIRVAQGIGLHLRPSHRRNAGPTTSHSDEFRQMQSEMRRRVWGGCITLDSVLSMAYGRPLMIHPSMTQRTELPSEIDDDRLGKASNTPVPRSLMTFYVHSLKLVLILGDIMNTFYSWEEACDDSVFPDRVSMIEKVKDGGLQSLLKLDASLTNWHEGLPQHLLIGQNDIDPREFNAAVFTRQASVLRARYLHMRIFLLRPSLLVLYDGTREFHEDRRHHELLDSTSQQSILEKTSKICLSLAQELAELLCHDVETRDGPSSAWWYNVFYIYTCATVIHTARLCSSFEYLNTEKQLSQSWKQCLKFLKRYRHHSRSARNCYRALEKMDEQMLRNQKSKEPSSSDHPHRSQTQGGSDGASNGVQGGFGTSWGTPFVFQEVDAIPSCDASGSTWDDSLWMGDMGDMSWLTATAFTADFGDQF